VANPSIRSLAKQVGVSIATVSLALRDSPRVLPQTKERVRRAAAAAAYRPNPLVRSVMSSLRRSTHESFHGALLAIEYSRQERPVLNPYHRQVYQGAQRRAAELGYSLELCWVGPKVLSLSRFNSIVATRRVQGVIIMPFAETVDFSSVKWEALSAASIDFCVSAPTLHTVLPDHQLSMLAAMKRLDDLGYKRPGLCLERWRDARIKHRWSAGFTSFFREHNTEPILPLLIDETIDREQFLAWFKRHRPDVIVGHLQENVITWLRGKGLSVPRDVGFFQLNWHERSGPCAGLDPRPALLGSTAVDTSVAQLHRNERGIPVNPSLISLPLEWIDGPTVRTK